MHSAFYIFTFRIVKTSELPKKGGIVAPISFPLTRACVTKNIDRYLKTPHLTIATRYAFTKGGWRLSVFDDWNQIYLDDLFNFFDRGTCNNIQILSTCKRFQCRWCNIVSACIDIPDWLFGVLRSVGKHCMVRTRPKFSALHRNCVVSIWENLSLN